MNNTEIHNYSLSIGQQLDEARKRYDQLTNESIEIDQKKLKVLSSMQSIFAPVLVKMHELGYRNIDGEESIRFVNFHYDRFRARDGGKGMLPTIVEAHDKRLHGTGGIRSDVLDGETFVKVGSYTAIDSNDDRDEFSIMLPAAWFYEPENWETRYTELFNELMIPILKQEQVEAQEKEQIELENFRKLKAKFEPTE